MPGALMGCLSCACYYNGFTLLRTCKCTKVIMRFMYQNKLPTHLCSPYLYDCCSIFIYVDVFFHCLLSNFDCRLMTLSSYNSVFCEGFFIFLFLTFFTLQCGFSHFALIYLFIFIILLDYFSCYYNWPR